MCDVHSNFSENNAEKKSWHAEFITTDIKQIHLNSKQWKCNRYPLKYPLKLFVKIFISQVPYHNWCRCAESNCGPIDYEL